MNQNVIDLNIKRMAREINQLIELETPHYDNDIREARQSDCRVAVDALVARLRKLHGIKPVRARLEEGG